MTISGDFTPTQSASAKGDSSYPVLFGISLTPTVSGILIAVLGLGSAVYLLVNFIQPLWQQKQQLEQEIATKQDQLARQAETIQQIEQVKTELKVAQQRQKDVLTLFADQTELKTLLLDLNRIVQSRNGTLVRFEPATPSPEPVNDGTLGAGVNGRLLRQAYKVELEGTFEETRSIILTLERLKPLLVVRNFKSELGSQKAILRPSGKQSAVLEFDRTADKLKTSFDLLALLPASGAAATPPPAQ